MVRRSKIISPKAFYTFGELLTYLRKRAELTQEELARAVGYSRAHIARLEGNQRVPDFTTVAARFIPNLDLDLESDWVSRLLELAAEAHNIPVSFSITHSLQHTFTFEEFVDDETRPSIQHNLPAPLTAFIGRESELAALGTLLTEPTCRLITLYGLGGIGKTRLALQVAAEQINTFKHGVWFVSLAPLKSTDEIGRAIADALSFQLVGQDDPQSQLLNYLRERELLLVLDNFEHLMDGAGIITEIIGYAARVKVLVTSRERLNLYGEWAVEVGGLTFPAENKGEGIEGYSAVQLFVECAKRAWSLFSLQTEDRSSVVRICQLLGGIPLALELASAWLPVLSCAEIEREIRANLSFLAASPQGVAERHHNMRAVFDYSWSLLDDQERAVFQRLSVFRGGFTREAAEAVSQVDLNILKQLTAMSLIRRMASGRYEIHELLRQYGFERLVASNESGQAQDRHLMFFTSFAEQAEVELTGPRQVAWNSRVDAELNNIQAALTWSLTRSSESDASSRLMNREDAIQQGLRLAGALYFYWGNNMAGQGINWLSRLLRQPEAWAPTEARANALIALSYLGYLQFEIVSAAEEALAIYYKLEDQRGIARSLCYLGRAFHLKGESALGYSYLSESLAILQASDDKSNLLECVLMELGKIAMSQDSAQARFWFEENLALCREHGNLDGIAYGLQLLGFLESENKNYAIAHDYLAEALEIRHSIGNKSEILAVYEMFGALLLRQGDYERARAFLEEYLSGIGEQGIYNAWSVVRLGYVALRQGKLAEARSLFMNGQQRFMESSIKSGVVYALEGLASLAVARGGYVTAVCLFAWADATRESILYPRPPADQTDVDRDFMTINAHLAEAEMVIAQAEGSKLTIEQAVAYALREMSL